MKPLQQRIAVVVVFLLGLALVVYGVGRYSPPAAYIVAGLLIASGAAIIHNALHGSR